VANHPQATTRRISAPSPNPTFSGRTFQRWSQTINGTTAFNFNTDITSSFTLFAVWNPPVMPVLPLSAPDVFISGTTATWLPISGAIGYHIYVDGEQVTDNPVTGVMFNLNTLGLPIGTYQIQVRAIGDGVNHLDSPLSNPLTFGISQLSAPTNLNISGTTLTWNPVSNAGGYHIYVDGERETDEVVTTTSFNLHSLGLGVGSHDIQVRAIGDGVLFTDSNLSAVREFTIVQLDAPTGLSVDNGFLSWQLVANATSYQISINGTTIPVITSPFDLRTLDFPVGIYDVRVRAIGNGTTHVSSEFSQPAEFIVYEILSAPTGLELSGLSMFSWSAVTNAIGYHVYVDGVNVSGATPVTELFFDLATLGLGVGNHIIRVSAVGNGVTYLDSALSTESATFIVQQLGTAAIALTDTTIISWGAVTNAIGYHVYVGVQRRSTELVTGLSFDVHTLGLAIGTHVIRVRAIGNGVTFVDSILSNDVSYVIVQLTTPSISISGAIVRWNPVPNAVGYTIFLSGDESTFVAAPATEFNLISLNLAVGWYSVRVRAIGNGTTFRNSFLSSTLQFTIQVLPEPEMVAINETILTWWSVPMATGYRIFVGDELVATIPVMPTPVTFDLLPLGLGIGVYSITIQAIGNGTTNVDSALSEPVIYMIIKLDTPEVTINGTHVSWDVVPNTLHYRVYINDEALPDPVMMLSINLANLSLGTGTFRVRVRAIGNNTTFLHSDHSDEVVCTIVRLNAPTNISISGTAILSWNVVPNATGYQVLIGGAVRTSVLSATTFNLALIVPRLGLGTHDIQVQALGNNTTHLHSSPSDVIPYLVAHIDTPTNLAINGTILSWTPLTGADYYEIIVGGVVLAESLITLFDLASIRGDLVVGYHAVQVRAIGNGANWLNSAVSSSVQHVVSEQLATPVGKSVNNSIVSWTAVAHATAYHIYVGGQRVTETPVTQTTFNLENLILAHGVHNIQVRAISSASFRHDSNLSSGVNYTISIVLEAPVVTIENDVVRWTEVEGAIAYHIYLNNSFFASVEGLSVNISSLPAGSHNITIMAVGDGVLLLNSSQSLDRNVNVPASRDLPITEILIGLAALLLLVGIAAIAAPIFKRKKT
jgi:hypothetical protein